MKAALLALLMGIICAAVDAAFEIAAGDNPVLGQSK